MISDKLKMLRNVQGLRLVRLYTTKAKRSVLLQDTELLETHQYPTSAPGKLRTYVWGLSRTGALGINTAVKGHDDYYKHIVHNPTRLKFAENNEVTDIAAGYGFSAFAVKRSDGETLFGTGMNTDRQLGMQQIRSGVNLDIVIYPAPINLPKREDEQEKDMQVKSMSAGRAHLVVLTKNGAVFTLGNNAYGQCARRIVENEVFQGSGMVHRIDGLAGEGEQLETVVCGQDHTIFITESGKLWSCGWGADGQTGLGHYNSTGEASLIRGDVENEKIVKVASFADCVLALNDKGEVFGWGNTEYGQLFDSNEGQPQVNSPQFLEITKGLGKIVDIASGGPICMVLNEAGDVFTWGYGILGFGPNVEQSSKPKQLLPPLFGRNEFNHKSKVISIHSGVFHMGAVNSDGDLFMWGKNRFGCLGLGHKKDQYFPFKTAINAKVVKIACGVDHTLALCKPFI